MPSNQEQLAARAAAPRPRGGGKNVVELLNSMQGEIARALPKHLDADRLVRIATTEIRRTPKLADCDAMTLLGAIMMSAQTGLEPGPLGHCYLVPYKRDCTWILGYKGILELARRSGRIQSIIARAVYSNDEFSFEYGLDEQLHHRPAMEGERGDLVAVYGIAKYLDGGHTMLVMSRADIDKRRERSAAKTSGPWVTDYEPMALKTVVRAMAPWLPLTIEAAEAISSDESVIRYDTDLAATVVADPRPAIEAVAEPQPEPGRESES